MNVFQITFGMRDPGLSLTKIANTYHRTIPFSIFKSAARKVRNVKRRKRTSHVVHM